MSRIFSVSGSIYTTVGVRLGLNIDQAVRSTSIDPVYSQRLHFHPESNNRITPIFTNMHIIHIDMGVCVSRVALRSVLMFG